VSASAVSWVWASNRLINPTQLIEQSRVSNPTNGLGWGTHVGFCLTRRPPYFDLCEIVVKNINVKANKKYFRDNKKQLHWHNTCASEIETFLEILLYMRLPLMTRIIDYWSTNSKCAIHESIIQVLSLKRWKQIKRFLKIFDSFNDEIIDTRDLDWWKKLKSRITSFRKASKKYWISVSHLSVDEHLILYRDRSCHIMQIAIKATDVDFKIYSLCQENYLYDFLFSSKMNQKMS
jgi:hypothetical protein